MLYNSNHLKQLKTSRIRYYKPLLIWLLLAGLLLTALITLSACSPPENQPSPDRDAQAYTAAYLNDILQTELMLSPETASRIGLQAYAGPKANSRLDDHSQAGFERTRLLRLELLAQRPHRPILPTDHPLNRDLEITTEALSRLSRLQLIGQGRLSLSQAYPYAVDPFSGAWIEGINLLLNTPPINTLSQAEAYVARLTVLPGAIDDTRRRLLADAKTGTVPPKALLKMSQTRINALLTPEPEPLALLVTTLKDLMQSPTQIRPRDAARLMTRSQQIITNDLIPAYHTLLSTLKDLSKIAPVDSGLWVQPNGDAIYTAFINWQMADTVSTLDDVHVINHQYAQTQKAILKNQLSKLGLEGALTDQIRTFQAMHQSQSTVSHTQTSPPSPQAFTVPTSANLIVQNRKLTAYLPSLTGIWFEPTGLEHSGPNRLLINQDYLNLWPTWLHQTLVAPAYYHRHTDLAAAMRRTSARSQIRRLTITQAFDQAFTSYQTLYPLNANTISNTTRIGLIHLQLIDAALAVIDTGLHSKRWTIEQATAYFEATTALPADLVDIAIVFTAARPGEATSRLMGLRRLQSLRTRAEAILGDKFDETSFNSALLGDGSRPFTIVERDVERWYQTRIAQAN